MLGLPELIYDISVESENAEKSPYDFLDEQFEVARANGDLLNKQKMSLRFCIIPWEKSYC